MKDVIKLVQGDTRPQLIFSLMDEKTNEPIDVSPEATTVVMKFRELDSPTTKAVLPCEKISGYLNPTTGVISYDAPYNQPGAGGRVFMNWSESALDLDGDFEGEIEVTFPDGTVHTVYEKLRFLVRAEFA